MSAGLGSCGSGWHRPAWALLPGLVPKPLSPKLIGVGSVRGWCRGSGLGSGSCQVEMKLLEDTKLCQLGQGEGSSSPGTAASASALRAWQQQRCEEHNPKLPQASRGQFCAAWEAVGAELCQVLVGPRGRLQEGGGGAEHQG